MEQGIARSDLAAECGAGVQGAGISVQHAEVGACHILRVRIGNEAAARKVGKPQGRYVTVEFEGISALAAHEREEVQRAVAVELRELAERSLGTRLGARTSVLVVGLGNASMTADALGPEVVRRLCVTRHLGGQVLPNATCTLSAFSPGVLGQTGIEAEELVRGAVSVLKPDLVLAVDALAARSPQRLAATVQISDAGIQPGGGVGNPRAPLTAAHVGVPVLAIGVPTVVDSATLVADALAEAGLAIFGETAQARLRNARPLLVSPREIDIVIAEGGVLLAGAIERAFSLS